MAELRRPEPLAARHRAAGFDCGVPGLNRWLGRADGATVFVTVDAEDRVGGFYALAPGTVRPERDPIPGARSSTTPVLKLGRLGVDRRLQGRGIGSGLVADALARSYAVSRHAEIAALLAEALDDRAADWLKGFGFARIAGEETAMVLPLATIEALVEGRA